MSPSELQYSTPRDLAPSPLRLAVDSVVNVLFPSDCLSCATPVWRLQDLGVCDRCWAGILALRCGEPMCPSCGLPYHRYGSEKQTHLCGRCVLDSPAFSGARSYGYYRSQLRAILHSFKYGGMRNLTGLLAPLLASTFRNHWNDRQADGIVAVPLHPARERERGFNQSALLARGLSDMLGVPVMKDTLRRVRRTAPQSGLSEQRRKLNVRNAFRIVRGSDLIGRTVLLVDDVMTTGATAASAAGELRRAGALRVWVLTVARAVPGPDA